MATPSLILKQFDTFPGWVLQLADSNGWMAITGANSVKFVAKQVSGSATIGPTNASIMSENSFTANTTLNSNVLTSVSSFTGIVNGSTITGNGIPQLATVGSFDTVANTITMVLAVAPGAAVQPANATKTATAVACIGNRGQATYTPSVADTTTAAVFSCEAPIHWDAGGTMIQKVPNAAASNPQIEIDPDITGSAE